MAFFSDLVRAVAQAEGMDEMTVTGIGQYLRDEGMITKGGRGRSAARMSSQDGANLLIAVNATALAKDSAKAARSFRDLETEAQLLDNKHRPLAELSLGPKTFGNALERLIDWCSPDPIGESKIHHILSQRSSHSIKGADRKVAIRKGIDIPPAKLEIVFKRPALSAVIQFADPHLSYSKNEILFFKASPMNFDRTTSISGHQSADRRDLTIITDVTLKAVAEVIHS